ncbi:rCG40774 [Rattus norvegicus]|uniref:RCG40774 n=1 Tax=Rattus norvegicus TaxID=10116 RepID=A6KNX8_RAT|nr:rCG40774 [Rattus norvegicus]
MEPLSTKENEPPRISKACTQQQQSHEGWSCAYLLQLFLENKRIDRR